MNTPLNPSLPALLPAAMPGANGLPQAGRPLPVGPAVPGMPVAAFAQDLAQLLMASALPAAPAAALNAGDVLAEAATDADDEVLTDAVAALWIELGIAAQPVSATPVAHAQIGTALQAERAAATSPTSPAAAITLPTQAAAEALAKIEAQPAANDAVQFEMPTSAAAPLLTLPEAPRPAAVPPAVVDVRLPQAPQQIAETVVWNVGKGLSEVQIRLNPEDLGPLEVHLKLDGDKVAVRFDAADASVRDVVQTSLPQLATLLSARGLQLDQAQVFQQDRGQSQTQPQHHTPFGEPRHEDEAGEGEARPVATITRRRGLFDDWV